ncbi:hypothetical protein Bca4012_087875 [Brassica carinata]|uniref:Uncharacterized protein n=1 Tax=Brassica oleracea var. oleracea TaxID=109376 RepID=A0A0D3A5N9_BRAOL|nr:PREDICTED: uncharacterized protein LOC106312069 [Brassica oleracea var. oleracea]
MAVVSHVVHTTSVNLLLRNGRGWSGPRRSFRLEILISNLPESETRDEKISEATASTPPPLSRSSVHDQSIRMADLALEKKNHINTKNTPTLKAFESNSST